MTSFPLRALLPPLATDPNWLCLLSANDFPEGSPQRCASCSRQLAIRSMQDPSIFPSSSHEMGYSRRQHGSSLVCWLRTILFTGSGYPLCAFYKSLGPKLHLTFIPRSGVLQAASVGQSNGSLLITVPKLTWYCQIGLLLLRSTPPNSGSVGEDLATRQPLSFSRRSSDLPLPGWTHAKTSLSRLRFACQKFPRTALMVDQLVGASVVFCPCSLIISMDRLSRAFN